MILDVNNGGWGYVDSLIEVGVEKWQVTLFIVLYTVTFFRKTLSSNRVYLSEGGHHDAPDILEARIENPVLENSRRRRASSSFSENELWDSMHQNQLIHVSSFLQPEDLVRLGQTCKGGNKSCQTDLVWKKQWENRFGKLIVTNAWKKCLEFWDISWEVFVRKPPSQGWKRFFFEFEASWINMVAAGHDTLSSCLIGIEGGLYDITNFIDLHPGSPETLLENAGRDVTQFFNEVGHSATARRLMRDHLVFATTDALVKLSSSFRLRMGGVPVTLATREGRYLASFVNSPLPEGAAEVLRTACLRRRAAGGGPAGPAAPAAAAAFSTVGAGGRKAFCNHRTGPPRLAYLPPTEEWAAWWPCCGGTSRLRAEELAAGGGGGGGGG
eukprot:CAMPEP_0194579116 /NCGR_PEP_ID=MMETSP0292-20121207/13287_1 /TAXON_ID=39354 /ORGANISM="Heterosigma akashiwo, Strain CCMP2393" /LENGTH=382 /DNA_ID=CAMNT_0039431955 /DNA_START=361 /DNA_END=1505 /DNA_ORIENTATION=+